MATAEFTSIPTINLSEVVRVVVGGVAYDAEEIFSPAGSRAFAYTDASGTVRIVRIKN